MRIAFIALLALLGGCQQLTDVLVRIDSTDLTSADISKVKIVVTDLDLAVDAPAEYAPSELLVCAPGQTSDCNSFPITVTLAPGSRSPTDKVRVEVDTFANDGSAFSSDASTFSFTPHHEQHVDFYLSKNCGGTDCASANLACGTEGTCGTLTATTSVAADLATPVTSATSVSRVSFATSEWHTVDTSTYAVTPPDTQSGDLIVFGVVNANATEAQVVPAGWQLLAQTGLFSAVLYHFATGEEIGDTGLYTFTPPESSDDGTWSVTVLRGVAAPIRAVTDTIVTNSTGNAYTIPLDDGSAVQAGGELIGLVLSVENTAACTAPNARTMVHAASGATLIEVTGGGSTVEVPCVDDVGDKENDLYQFVVDPAQ